MRARSLLLASLFGILITPSLGWSAKSEFDRVKYGEGALTFASGWIRESLPIDGSVSVITGDPETTGNKRLLGQGHVIYLTLKRPEEVSPGDLYTIYRYIHLIQHPADGRYLGNLFMVLGVAEVVEGNRNPATVRILRSYGAMRAGDQAMRFVPPPLAKEQATMEPPEGEGVIVALPPLRTLTAQNQVVYIDWGKQHGLRSGDRLEVFRDTEGLPRRVIGELKVLGVGEHTSSAVITVSNYHYRRGDRFEFKERPDLADLEEASEEASVEVGTAKTSVEVGTKDPEPVVARIEPTPPAEGTDSIETGDREKLVLEGLVDQLEFDSGEVTIKPEGIKVLDQVSEALSEVSDKQVKVEGHTDNVPVGPTLSQTYPSNWELSRARADEVVRYLVEKSGVDPTALSAVGQAETQPIASNATEDGRQKNRRVEILVYSPKQSTVAPDATSDSGGEPAEGEFPTDLQKEIESLLSLPGVESEPVAEGEEDPSAPLTDLEPFPADGPSF